MIEIFKNQIKKDMLKPSYGPYRNPWFLVEKKEKGKYRLINTTIEINHVIVRDTNLSPSINEFFKKFAGCVIASLIDFFSGYNQIELDEKSKDLTAFYTSIGLLRIIILS